MGLERWVEVQWLKGSLTDLIVWGPCDPKAELLKVLTPEEHDPKGHGSGKSH